MHATLNAFNLTARPLIKAVPLEELRSESARLEGLGSESTPLKNYWRIDLRRIPEQMEQIEQSLKQLPEVKQIYREKILTEAVSPENDVFSEFQDYLGEPGVNAEPIWDLLGEGSTGLHFIDLEQGWIRDHEGHAGDDCNLQ